MSDAETLLRCAFGAPSVELLCKLHFFRNNQDESKKYIFLTIDNNTVISLTPIVLLNNKRHSLQAVEL